MLKEHNVLRLGTPDLGIQLEVNWSDDAAIRDCQVIRVSFPKSKDGGSFVIKKEELNALTFAMGTKSEQMKMIPIVETRSRHYETVLGITATKNIKKGEKIVFPVSIPLPTFSEEIISEAKRDAVKNHQGLPLIGT